MTTIILGAGPIGLALAYEIATRGEEVTVISTTRNTGAAAEVNAGWIVPIMASPVPAPGMVKKSLGWMLKPDSPLKISMAPRLNHISFMAQMLAKTSPKHFAHGLHALSEFGRGALDAFEKYQRQGVDFELHKTGVLMAFLSENELDAHFAEFENSHSYGQKKVIRLTGKEIRLIEPALSKAVTAGINCSDQYFVNPSTLMHGLRNSCKKLGVKFYETANQCQIKIVRAGGIELTYEGMTVHADRIIIAAGVESRKLLNQIGFDLPLKFGKGYCLDFSQEKEISHALYLSEAKVAVTPLTQSLRLAGTMEFGGNPLKMRQQRVDGILKSSAQYFSFSMKKPSQLGMGLRPMTPDGMPVIGKVPGTSNVFVATGHAMLGVTLAPATAKLLADFIFSPTDSEHLRNFSPDRF